MLKIRPSIRPKFNAHKRLPEEEPIKQTCTDGLVVLEFDLPGEKINKLSASVLEKFERVIDELR
ncbi:MAG: hypothetical protein O2857_30250, partial [Planctomycetota bacterium]|nr:hypothetical protein [Planctomycetota bacterium]